MLITSKSPKLGKKISFKIKKETGKDNSWKCPVCGQETTYVKKSKNGRIPHFRHLNKADHPRISEGQKHSKAKHKIFNKIKKNNNYKKIELERPVGDQIADIFIQLQNGDKIAIEIQCSTQGKLKFKERTQRYTDKDIHTLWILDQDSFLGSKSTKNGSTEGISFPKSVRWIQKNWYGRFYSFTRTTLRQDSLKTVRPNRLQSKQKTKEYFDSSGILRTQNKYYKTIGYFVEPVSEKYTKQIPNYGICTDNSNGYKIARFYDKCWWKN